MNAPTAIVTGASSGIGLACARQFLASGHRVVAQYRTQAEPVAALLDLYGGERVVAAQADLATEADCEAIVRAALADADGGERPRLILVHSAGIWNAGPIATLDREILEQIFRTNTFSAFYLARTLVRVATGGSIILIGSTAGERGEPGHSHYAASKAALWGLVQSLAQELAPHYRVNLVSPGWVRTPMVDAALAGTDRLAKIIDGVPLARIAEPEDIARAVAFLADDAAARHLTGVDLPVSGGALLPVPRG